MVFMEMGNHWKIIFAKCGLLVCSMGKYFGVPWEINGVHSKVGVNNIGLKCSHGMMVVWKSLVCSTGKDFGCSMGN